MTVCFGLEASVNLWSQRLLGSWSCEFPESTGFPGGICQKSAASQCVWEELLLEAHCPIWVPRDAAEGPGSWGVKLSGRAPPRNGLWPTVWRQVDRRPDGPQGPEPLPGQEARTTAELDEELPFTQPVGLDHLAERFVRVAAGVVADARGPQLREARLTSAAVPAGAFTTQAVFITPSAYSVGQARHALWVETLATGRDAFPVLEVEIFGTVDALFSAGPHAGPAGVMAFPTFDQLRIKVGARFTVWNAAAPCKAESFFTDSALLGFPNALFAAWVAFKAIFLTFISIKSVRTKGHTGIRLLLVIEPAAAGQALSGAPTRAGLTPLLAPAASSYCCVPKVAQGAHTHALPAGLGAPQAEVGTVEALVCAGAITAFVPTLRMAHTGL